MSTDPEGWPGAYRRRVLDAVPSTNAVIRAEAAQLRGPVWVLAHDQTAGVGRRGRVWRSVRGNFSASLGLPLMDPPSLCALRSFVAALALHDALDAHVGARGALTLKWPNDVLLNDGKLAGILLENVAGTGGGANLLIIGIGVNLAGVPDPQAGDEPGALRPVSLRAETGIDLAPERLLTGLARAFDAHEKTLRREGFAPLRRLWLARAARLGQTITARLSHETVTGTFETIDSDGQLVLTTPEARRRIPAADIYF